MKQTIVIEEYPQNEMQTINWYRALGWEMANNQTIVSTSVHSDANGHISSSTLKKVKLTFERDTTAPNFSILNEYYNRCLPYLQEKNFCENTIRDGGTKKNWWTLAGISVPVGAIIGYELSVFFIGEFVFFLAFYSIIPASLFSFLIGYAIMYIRTKKKFRPRLKKAIEEIEKITNESAQYVE